MTEVLVDLNTLIKRFYLPLLDKVEGQVDEINWQFKRVHDMLDNASKVKANKLVHQRHQIFERLDLRLVQSLHLATHGESAGDDAVVNRHQRQLEGHRNVLLQQQTNFFYQVHSHGDSSNNDSKPSTR